MRFGDLAEFRSKGGEALARGPVCLILSEDGVELQSTIAHHLDRGFRKVVVFAHPSQDISADPGGRVIGVVHDMTGDHALEEAVNAAIATAPAGTWMSYVYNAEYLYYPFCEDRTIGELCTFCTEERRDSVLSYVVDLYPADLGQHPDGVDRAGAMFDRMAHYALARPGADRHPKERQLNFFGGLRWRFEEFVPPNRRRIDRIAIFRTKADLRLGGDHTFSDEEYNTYACPWHNSPTAVVASFRTAKALRRNPGSRKAVTSFAWRNSTPLEGTSRQFMDLGMMEPGQWF